jgi:site-specific DNA recombinase
VIGEYERAFYGSQYASMAPLFEHYGIALWMPGVGGRVDWHAEDHEQTTLALGLSSKREITRTRIRVRTAMAAQTREQGRYLGGRPPYGYRLGDAGPHRNKAPAAWGRRAHRTGAAILANPRYTGRQVWNRQRTDFDLADPANTTLGHRQVQRWNLPEGWVISQHPAHAALVSEADFIAAQETAALRGPARPAVRRARHSCCWLGLSCGERFFGAPVRCATRRRRAYAAADNRNSAPVTASQCHRNGLGDRVVDCW